MAKQVSDLLACRPSYSPPARPCAALARPALLEGLAPRAAVSARANRWCSRSIRSRISSLPVAPPS